MQRLLSIPFSLSPQHLRRLGSSGVVAVAQKGARKITFIRSERERGCGGEPRIGQRERRESRIHLSSLLAAVAVE